jgi:hypothetical protein
MIVAISDVQAIVYSLCAAVVVIGLLALLRTLLRREPTPSRWRRYRLGVFVERDPQSDGRTDEPYESYQRSTSTRRERNEDDR